MNQIALTGLVDIALPNRTVRFADGGFIVYEGETFTDADDVFGTIAELKTMAEGVGDIVPSISMTLLPPDASVAIDVSQPGNQTSRVRFIIAEYDPETGTAIEGNTFFDGQIDQSVFSVGRGVKEVALSVVSLAERLFERNIGNTLNPVFHKSVWPGELGHDNATGLTKPVAWGVEAAVGRGFGTVGGGGSDARAIDFRNYERPV